MKEKEKKKKREKSRFSLAPTTVSPEHLPRVSRCRQPNLTVRPQAAAWTRALDLTMPRTRASAAHTILRPLWSRSYARCGHDGRRSQGLCIDADARLDLANFFAATKDCHVRPKS